jgi:hypothetical protein
MGEERMAKDTPIERRNSTCLFLFFAMEHVCLCTGVSFVERILEAMRAGSNYGISLRYPDKL